MRARWLRRRRVRRAAGRHPVALGPPGHDRPPDRCSYRSPTPLHAELHLVGEITKVEGRKIFTEGRLYAADPDGTQRLCAEAEGLFIAIDFSRFAELKAQREEAERDRLAR